MLYVHTPYRWRPQHLANGVTRVTVDSVLGRPT